MEAHHYDVVCIGAGGAGVAAAVAAARHGARTAIVAKEPIGYGNTRIALGGMACTGMVAEDDVDAFVDDILAGGDRLSDPALARTTAQEAPAAVAMLESFGCYFERDEEGRLSAKVARRVGGHSLPRTATTINKGTAIGAALRAAVAAAGVDAFEDTAASRLLVQNGRVVGAVCLHLPTGEPLVLAARAVLLATGGTGWLYYPHTDTMRVCTGDGFALAYWAGAELVDMEQVQFIPFAITHPRSLVGIFCGEPAHAGDGVLCNRRGEVVLAGIARLTRAQVAKTIALAVRRGEGSDQGGLLLDMSPNLAASHAERLRRQLEEGGILATVRAAYGERAARWEEPWDVAPAAHFQMGGVVVDPYGRSSVPGLYAAGEVQGGVHGGNRLGSVALTEIFVFGRRAGEAMARDAAALPPRDLDASLVAAEVRRVEGLFARRGSQRPVTLMRRLQATMWQNVGPVRDEADLATALGEIENLAALAADSHTSPNRRYNLEALDALELDAMLTTARLIVRSALERRESRGAHVRLDYPERDDTVWLRNIVVRQERGSLATFTREVRR